MKSYNALICKDSSNVSDKIGVMLQMNTIK